MRRKKIWVTGKTFPMMWRNIMDWSPRKTKDCKYLATRHGEEYHLENGDRFIVNEVRRGSMDVIFLAEEG